MLINFKIIPLIIPKKKEIIKSLNKQINVSKQT